MSCQDRDALEGGGRACGRCTEHWDVSLQQKAIADFPVHSPCIRDRRRPPPTHALVPKLCSGRRAGASAPHTQPLPFPCPEGFLVLFCLFCFLNYSNMNNTRRERCFGNAPVWAKACELAQRATHNEAAMDATPSKVGCILCQVHGSQPLHYPVVGPLHNFGRGKVTL